MFLLFNCIVEEKSNMQVTQEANFSLQVMNLNIKLHFDGQMLIITWYHDWGSQPRLGVAEGEKCTHFPVQPPGSLEHLSRRMTVCVSFQLV